MPNEMITTKHAAIKVIKAVLFGIKFFLNHLINFKDLFKSLIKSFGSSRPI